MRGLFSLRLRAGLAICAMAGGAALYCPPAAAQAQGNTDELLIYGGWLSGDVLTQQPLSGLTPRAADHVTYGVRYDHNFTPAWGLDLAVGQTPTQVLHAAPGSFVRPDLRLQTADLDVIWTFTPDRWAAFYTLMGAGYARARLGEPLVGIVEGEPASLGEKGSVSANLGGGVRCYLTRHLIVRAEARYRFISGVLSADDHSLSTVETTLGLGLRF